MGFASFNFSEYGNSVQNILVSLEIEFLDYAVGFMCISLSRAALRGASQPECLATQASQPESHFAASVEPPLRGASQPEPPFADAELCPRARPPQSSAFASPCRCGADPARALFSALRNLLLQKRPNS